MKPAINNGGSGFLVASGARSRRIRSRPALKAMHRLHQRRQPRRETAGAAAEHLLLRVTITTLVCRYASAAPPLLQRGLAAKPNAGVRKVASQTWPAVSETESIPPLIGPNSTYPNHTPGSLPGKPPRRQGPATDQRTVWCFGVATRRMRLRPGGFGPF